MNAAVRPLLDAAHVPGCSAALVGRAGVFWSHGFGFADLKARRPAEPRTVYHLFSGTKLFTATAVVQLAERGRLSLDDQVAKYLPELSALGDLTIRDLLSHRSGLADSLRSFLAVTLSTSDAPSTKEALSRYRVRARRAPRTKVEYRNVNYAILGHVVTLASGVKS